MKLPDGLTGHREEVPLFDQEGKGELSNTCYPVIETVNTRTRCLRAPSVSAKSHRDPNSSITSSSQTKQLSGLSMIRKGRRGHPWGSGLLLAVMVVADLIETEFVSFIRDHLLAGVPEGDDALDGQLLRETQKPADILR